MKIQTTKSGIEFKVLTGPEHRLDGKLGRVRVRTEQAVGSHGYIQNNIQVYKNTKGFYITINKEKTYIELPDGHWVKGEFTKVWPDGGTTRNNYTYWVDPATGRVEE